MTVDTADPRLLLPRLPTTAAVVADRPDWTESLQATGATLVPAGEGPDLMVADDASLERALAARPPSVIVAGGTQAHARALGRAGYRSSRWLALGNERTEALIPLAQGRVGRYAVLRWRPPASRTRRLAGAAVLSSGARLPGLRTSVVASREAGPPAVVRAVEEAGAGIGAAAFLGNTGLEASSRLAAFVFEERAAAPAWVVKVGRTRLSPAGSFEADRRALHAVAAYPVVARHAPRFLGLLDLDGHPASVETAAPGTSLARLLQGGGRRAADAIAAVAAWLVEVGASTAGRPPAGLADRLRRDVLAAHGHPGGAAEAVDRLATVPSVFAHHDLGTWNLVCEGTRFTVLDWESATSEGAPLWDLAYFLGDALAQLDGARTVDERTAAMADLFAGRAPSSPALFHWISEGARAAGVPADAVGPLVALSWLDHAVPPKGPDGRRRAPRWPAELLAARWLADPALGMGWKAWPG